MTKQQLLDIIADLKEVRGEISRINLRAGRAAFNPAATDALEAVMAVIVDEMAELIDGDAS